MIKFNERIRVNNIEISDEYICSFIEKMNKNKQIKSTFFETTTAMAFSYFNDQEVDVAVIETGLGGRLIQQMYCTQSYSFNLDFTDHTRILGDSLSKLL